jgi:ribosome-binding protein aMBF1 (putative translation factor)
MCGARVETNMVKGLICSICGKEKQQVILKMNNKGEVIRVCQNCNKKKDKI